MSLMMQLCAEHNYKKSLETTKQKSEESVLHEETLLKSRQTEQNKLNSTLNDSNE